MGLGEMLGIKSEKIETKSIKTIEELFEKIKDADLAAGKPELYSVFGAHMIVFPQVDRNNQVQISGNKGKFTCLRSAQPAGLDKFLANEALEKLTGGLTGWSAVAGDAKKTCMEQVSKTAEQIRAMNL